MKTVEFQSIQFSISTQFSSIQPIGKAQSGATTPDLSALGSDRTKGILCIPQSSRNTEASLSACIRTLIARI